MSRLIDRLSDLCGRLAAVLFVLIGVMITYEVVMRYAFFAPTTWAEEMSRFFQIWAVYIAAAFILRHRHLIVITVIVDRLPRGGRLAAELFALAWIAVFSAVALWYGVVTVTESIAVGRHTSTMLSVPQWMTEIAIPIGFGLLLLQCGLEAVRVLRQGPKGLQAADSEL
jgi:TRAP-type C4-dicarboxylate transport system permease small subunit